MSNGLLSLKWNNHSSAFASLLTKLRSDSLYSDATIACDGKVYFVHKLVLSTCSEYFEKIFSSTQCKHPVIVLKDTQIEEVEALLNYMYLGEVSVLQEKLSALINVAEALRIKGLAVPDEAPSSKKLTSEKKENVLRHGSPQSVKRIRRSEHTESRASQLHRRTDCDGKGHRVNTTHTLPKPPQMDEERWQAQRNETGWEHSSERATVVQGTRGYSASSNQDACEVIEIKSEPCDISESEQSEVIDMKETIPKLEDKLTFDSVESSASSQNTVSADVEANTQQQTYLGDFPSDQDDQDSSSVQLPGPSGLQGGAWDADSSLSGLEGYAPDVQDSSLLGNYLSWRFPSASEKHIPLDSNLSIRENHAEKSQNMRKELLCHLCSYKTYTKSQLNSHLKFHSGEKPYACHHCPYRAVNKSTLDKHIRVHTGEKPYSCPICPYRATQKSSIQSHMRVHYKEISSKM